MVSEPGSDPGTCGLWAHHASAAHLTRIEVAYSPCGYLLSQSKYIADILDQARLSHARIADTPLELNARYSSSEGVALSDSSIYRTLVGSLVYLTITRPDIAYAVHIVSQFVATPTTVHWAAVLRILRYLRGTQFQSLIFPSTSTLELRAYSDADWGGKEAKTGDWELWIMKRNNSGKSMLLYS
ncbi:uncharacterized mitochondrial protein AtMg00810-like [Humulus lupulus]|uniref:uncharacterized mitochondrial protein AtMg00810-like n=1 Tax=Humulus lupulus TaxID=3486 RepID=UPI002B408748|nr:uncharacterized mitochondrial protein AtMg00810-like [Humulus lupulus]